MNFELLPDDFWWLKVSFLSNLSDKISLVDFRLHETEEKFITVTGKLKLFSEKLNLWNHGGPEGVQGGAIVTPAKIVEL